MPFKKALSTAELVPGAMRHIDIDGTEVLIANVEGDFYALNNTCPHKGGSLADGMLEGNVVRCPLHGARFDVTTGKNAGPAIINATKIPVKDAQSFPVKVEGGDVMVDLGN